MNNGPPPAPPAPSVPGAGPVPGIGPVGPVRYAQRFVHGPAGVTVRSDRPEPLVPATIELYAYTVTAPGPCRWEITVHTGVVLDRASLDAWFAPGGVDDIGPGLWARSVATRAGRAFWIDGHAAVVLTDRAAGQIRVWCARVDSAVMLAARLVRQAMTANLVAHDAVHAHAAALSHRGRGVLICGPKGAGKTTVLLAALGLTGGEFVTNDRMLLRRSDNHDSHDSHDGAGVAGAGRAGTLGYARPEPVRASPATLAALSGVPGLLRRPTRAATTTRSGKIVITVGALREVLPGIRYAGTVRPTLMLWPHRCDHPPAEPGADPVAPSQVREVLRRTDLFMTDPHAGTTSRRNDWLLPADPTRAARTSQLVDELADHLARTVPCLRVPVPDDATALVEHLDLLLRVRTDPGGPHR